MAKVKYASRDFDRLYSLSTATRETEGDLRYPISGNVTFESVSFSYPSRPGVPILSGLSFKLSPGECVAIVGPSGSGKSTIAALLQRLYEPTSGQIKFDRFDLNTSDIKWLRNHIAVVSQSANLFDASVAENIAYGSDVPILEIQRAAKSANIHDFIQSLPKGYETNLGENASLISGGQAQRLQIARALVRRSNILILDECTSALDIDNQRAILDTIVKIKDVSRHPLGGELNKFLIDRGRRERRYSLRIVWKP
jgi:ATP-binding cassette subfamily B (MDR/TAP) protein 1